jgi:hypothetical protein
LEPLEVGMDLKHSYSPEEADVIRKAFVLAKRTFNRKLTNEESSGLAKAIMDLAARGCLEAEQLATRAVIRVIR